MQLFVVKNHRKLKWNHALGVLSTCSCSGSAHILLVLISNNSTSSKLSMWTFFFNFLSFFPTFFLPRWYLFLNFTFKNFFSLSFCLSAFFLPPFPFYLLAFLPSFLYLNPLAQHNVYFYLEQPLQKCSFCCTPSCCSAAGLSHVVVTLSARGGRQTFGS